MTSRWISIHLRVELTKYVDAASPTISCSEFKLNNVVIREGIATIIYWSENLTE